MASSPPPPSDTTAGAPSSSIATPRDTGKAPGVEATVLGGVLSTRVLRSARRTPAVGRGSSQPTPPNAEFEVPSAMGGDALLPFEATTYVLLIHIIGGGGSVRYRPPLSDVSSKILCRELEQHFGSTNKKANEKLRVWGSDPRVFELYERLPQDAKDAIALAGLRVGGDPLSIDPRIHKRAGAFEYLLGKVPAVSESGHITYSWLWEQFDHAGILTEVFLSQLVRAFLLYLLRQTLFCNKENSVHVQFLAALVNLETITEFDRGTPALATLYGHLSACSRGVSLSLGGHHRVLELWAFEHLLQFPPLTRHREPRFVPRVAHWLKGVWKTRCVSIPGGTLLDDAPLELTSARALDSQHFLLKGPFSRACMRSTHLLTGEGLLFTLERQSAVGFLQAGDYSVFHLALLAQPATAAAVTTPVWPRAPSVVSFHNANGEEERLPLTPCVSQLCLLTLFRSGCVRFRAQRPWFDGSGAG
ncbi:hypothetical protein RHMOL_Rhmol07G0211100 [Rhododendron molle]|uniref:Uncharacterized protein n=1 Tax=Rhododendron molle TaxID=49168 RepID=A0ACC0N436_RHOML|nr:hypothetical protein RHMOL_Rhmol07G0211100 [Rhododendron molle]